MTDFDDLMDSPEFFVKNQDWMIKYMIVKEYFEMLSDKKDYNNSKLNRQMNAVSYDKWTTGLITIYGLIKDAMIRDNKINKKWKGLLTKTIKFMDETSMLLKRPNDFNLDIATGKITSYLKEVGLLEFERKKQHGSIIDKG